jgi:hypothetical protein
LLALLLVFVFFTFVCPELPSGWFPGWGQFCRDKADSVLFPIFLDKIVLGSLAAALLWCYAGIRSCFLSRCATSKETASFKNLLNFLFRHNRKALFFGLVVGVGILVIIERAILPKTPERNALRATILQSLAPGSVRSHYMDTTLTWFLFSCL